MGLYLTYIFISLKEKNVKYQKSKKARQHLTRPVVALHPTNDTGIKTYESMLEK